MDASRFEATARRLPSRAIVDVRGDIDSGAEQRLAGANDEAIADDPTTVLLNYRDVRYITSTGIALIVGILARARTGRRAIAACGLSPHPSPLSPRPQPWPNGQSNPIDRTCCAVSPGGLL